MARSAAGSRLSVERFESRAMLAATITQVSSSLPAYSVYGIGQTLNVAVTYSEPVAVTSAPEAALGFLKQPSNTPALATYTGRSADGQTLNFSYTVQPGDQSSAFDVRLGNTPAPGFLIGGTIITQSDSSPADRAVDNTVNDPTLATLRPGIVIDGVTPPTPTVGPTLQVNPSAWQTGSWGNVHPDYFVLRGTIGAARALAAGEVLTVTVNGATYRSTGASTSAPATGFSVASNGQWTIRLRPLGSLPADAPFSGNLLGWSTTDGDTYSVVATLTNAFNNSASSTSARQIVIDTVAPTVAQVKSSTANGAYAVGATIDVSVMYSESIRVVGNVGAYPSIRLNISNLNTPGFRFATFAGVDPVDDRILHFSYTIQPGDNTPVGGSLDYVGSDAIAVGSGFIEDAAGNTARNTLNVPPGGQSPAQLSLVGSGNIIVVDTSAARVTGVSTTVPNGIYYAGGPVIPITVTFNEPVFVTGTPQLSLTSAAGRVATYAAGSGTNILRFNYVVQLGDDTGDANLDEVSATALQLNGGSIVDAANNAAVTTVPAHLATGSLAVNNSIKIAAAPTILAVTSPDYPGTFTAGDTVRIWITFSKVVSVVPGGLVPTLQLDVQSPIPAPVATFVGYVPNAPFPVPTTPYNTTTPSSILEFDYVVRPGDFTTPGSYLNYTVGGLTAGAGIRYTWTGAALPGYLDADITTLPAPTNALLNTLPAKNIGIALDTTAPVRPGVMLLTDSTRDDGVDSSDRYTNIPTVRVTGLETKPGGTYRYSVDAGANWSAWIPNASTFDLPAAGIYAPGDIQVEQRDSSGNVSLIGQNTQQWTLDLTPPAAPVLTFTLTGPAGSGFTNNPFVTVGNLETTGLLERYIGASPPPTGASPDWKWQNPLEIPAGIYDPAAGRGIWFRQQDLAGNYSSAVLLSNTPIYVDTTVATPSAALNQDTGVSGADSYTNNGRVDVSGLEVQNLGGPLPVSGLANWQYQLGTPTWMTAGTGSTFFTLPGNPALPGGAVYAAGTVKVRQTDLAGNVSGEWSNPTAWTVDQTAPSIQSATGTPTSAGIGGSVTITVTFSEPVWLSGGTATLSLNSGASATATLNAAQSLSGTTTMTFTYNVGVGQESSALAITGLTLSSGAALADRAGNAYADSFPKVLAGPVVIDAVIKATAPQLVGSTAPLGPVVPTLSSMLIVFNTPVRNFSLSSLRLYWDPNPLITPTRNIALTGATLRGSGTNYVLTLPKAATSAAGAYVLVVDGRLTGIVSTIDPTAAMTRPSYIYFQRALPVLATSTIQSPRTRRR